MPSSASALSFTAHSDIGYAGNTIYSVAVGDFNVDGRPDLVTPNIGTTNASVLLNNGAGGFPTKVNYGTGSSPRSVAVGDFNSDGKPDFAIGNYSGNSVSVLLNNGNGTFAAKADYATGNNTYWVAVGDFNGDGKQDLVTANRNFPSYTVSVLLNNGDGTFAPKVDYAAGASPQSVAVGDFNGDAHLDLVTANYNGASVSVLLNNGDGTFAAKVDYGASSDPNSVAVGDFNGDGKPDLVTANSYHHNTVSVLLNNGNGTFATSVDYATGSLPYTVAVADFNGDAKLDLVVANTNVSTVSVLLGNGNGTFAAKVDFATGNYPRTVAVGDFNGDAKTDLVTANYDGNSASVLLNQTPPPPTAVTNPATSVTGGSATLNGTVNPSSDPTTYHFEYGTTTAYGTSTAETSAGSGSSDVAVSAAVGSLTGSTVYHYRVVATNSGSTSNGSDQQFTTAPSSTVAPVISGTTTEGETLATTDGTWGGGAGLSYTYQWRRGSANVCTGASAAIALATSSTYALTSADVGNKVCVTVIATNGSGSATATSAATAVVRSVSNTVAPVVGGTVTDGQTLTTTNGSWTGPTPIAHSYQWRRGTGNVCTGASAAIALATSSTYVLTSADVGNKTCVTVTATNGGGSDAATSAATAVVQAVPVNNTAAPAVSGTATDGEQLSTTNGSWAGSTPIAHSYQWRRCDSAGANCADIAGATASAYTLTSGDVNHKLEAVVTADNSALPSGGSAVASSAKSAVINDTPTTTTNPATAVTSSSAILNGSVNPNSATTTSHFEYGVDTSYGNTTSPTSTGSGGSATGIDAAIGSLQPNKTYHFRVVARNAVGTTTGDDEIFTTSADPTPPRSAPTVRFTSGPPRVSNLIYATFTFAADQNDVGYECRVDGDPGGFTACGSPEIVYGLSLGQHRFEVRAQNRDGLTGPTADYSWLVDRKRPHVSVSHPLETLVSRGDLAHIYGTVADDLSNARVKLKLQVLNPRHRLRKDMCNYLSLKTGERIVHQCNRLFTAVRGGQTWRFDIPRATRNRMRVGDRYRLLIRARDEAANTSWMRIRFRVKR